MRQYQFVTGISLAVLEAEVNRRASEEPSLRLDQVLLVPGTGFVGVIERDVDAAIEPKKQAEPARSNDLVKGRKKR